MPPPTSDQERALGEAFQKLEEVTSRNAERRIRKQDDRFRVVVRGALFLNGGAALAALGLNAVVPEATQSGWVPWALGYLGVGALLAIVAGLAKTSALRHQLSEFAQTNRNRIRTYIEAGGSDPGTFGFADGDAAIHGKRKTVRALLANVLVALSISLFLAASTITLYGFLDS